MDYKQIIKDAWFLARDDRRLFWWWAFVPAILSIIVGIGMFMYQVMAFRYSPIPGTGEEHSGSFMSASVGWIYSFIDTHTSLGIVLIVIAAVLGLVYLAYPTFAKVALIQLIARIRNGQKVSMIDGITYGALGFTRLFEYHLLIKTFSVITLVTESIFVLRNLGWNAFEIIIIPFVLFGIFGLIMMLFLTYTDFYIVIDEDGIIKSMGRSMRLVIRNWRHTLLLLILMLVITLRIILNIVLVLLVPSLIFLAAGLIATVTLAKIGILIGAIVGLIALLFASYFTGILEVFANAVWVFTFLELTEQGEVSARDKGEGKRSARDDELVD
ncbi:hypothetical protein COW94_02995 [Candidatus Peregrinibacteria bacterium CG22_combo_CG10-13_8_21_14_all_44_10]|nr:MAG: hypothetical protein AUK45_04450 [Candidatus Peregrinibacteria bacterium CG2_30_44_17]PIP66207.1 MAG: hypothetical protein COW94_02995 [Candidatus Peregrinibacteria bacterium CG22_combo_CG10-13_8_21_14_all_44_10]PIS04367.1 MAG: hypothetical protein COT83_00940 [Candidatus Peregrinibacteria bacterium CG10_big_fil_rev_8_21_14_0_10_44_7]PIX79501.1 MAG: hypothetical protein COZ35_03340 [Candidatus Peregrinibacteria bacterium CG_4_10_14_3_um_filter_44_21]PJB88578.1 MAG: hypothetical protein 